MYNNMGKLSLAGLDKINDFIEVISIVIRKKRISKSALIYLIFNFKGIF